MTISIPRSRSYEEEQAFKNRMTQKAERQLAVSGVRPPSPLTDEKYYDNNLAYQEMLFTLVARFMNCRD